MKSFKTHLAAMICSAIVSTVLAASAEDKQGFVTVVRVQGNATYSLGPNQAQHPLVAGKYLAPGSIIFTKENAFVDIVLGKTVDFPQATSTPNAITPAADYPVRGYVSYTPSVDQNTVRLTPNTTLAIDKLTVEDTGSDTVSDTELDLQKGKIFASVRKLTGASQYVIKLPDGVAGVRGTKFSLDVNHNCACSESTGGGVVMAIPDGSGGTETLVIPPGQFFNPGTGSVGPMPPGLLQDLHAIFKSLSTSYFGLVTFQRDFTECHISPTQGIKQH